MELPSAFVYRWRLWGLPELRDAALEAGFARVDVYDRLADALDDAGNAYVRPINNEPLDATWVAYIACRKR
jgi:hypothetical protein